jgi:hypothetical protein
MSTYTDPIVQATLDFCNERRAEGGQPALTELPKGTREDPESCPCGKATGLHVDLTFYCEQNEYSAVDMDLSLQKPLPGEVQTFVENFDSGHYPELDENEGSVLRG